MAKVSALTFSMEGDQFLGRPYSEMDCQAFVEACMKKVGIRDNLPGSNAWYRKMTWVGTPEECRAKFGCIPRGALLYILKQDGREPAKYRDDGIGNASHIGIYIGRKDGAIHSSQSRGFVCYSKFAGKSIHGGWNRVGLWDRFDYGEKVNNELSGTQNDQNEVVIQMKKAVVKTYNGAGVNLRTQKATTSVRVCTIPENAEVIISEEDGTWSTVSYNGRNGYVLSAFLQAQEDTISLTVDRQTGEALLNALKLALGGDSHG
ncbi:MAG: SH3 domain-containing protein [Clostridia bacterium]|nr:SH3 domain-containing protein [Clostridia bacterium]